MRSGIKPDQQDAASLLNAIDQILGNSAYKQNARKISEGFKRCAGVKGAADKIISVCNDAV